MKEKLQLAATAFPALAAIFVWVGASSEILLQTFGIGGMLGFALGLAALASYSVGSLICQAQAHRL